MNETNLKPRTKATAIGVAGAAGASVVACAACCVSVPLIAPLLASLGISGLGAIAADWYLAGSAALALGVAGFLIVRRRRAQNSAAQAKCKGNCSGACQLRQRPTKVNEGS